MAAANVMMVNNAPGVSTTSNDHARLGIKMVPGGKNGEAKPASAWTMWPKAPKGQATPEVAEAATPENPLTKDDLVAHLRKGCTPRAKWRIGVEHEKFGFQADTKEPMSLDHIQELMERMVTRFGHERIMNVEGDTCIGLQKDGQNCTLEPGGQFELSGAPLEDIHAVKREIDLHLEEVNAIGKELGLGFAGIGYEPKWPISGFHNKTSRYEAIRKQISRIGNHEFETLHQTCTAQVNLDFESEQDMINKLRVGLSFQPIATALFANSPFSEGKPNGYLSYRSITWTKYDDKRTGELPFVFDDDFGFEKFTEYALNVPMVLVFRNQKWNELSDASFKDFMAGKLEGFEGERPSVEDFMNHLGTIYPEVRLKMYLEMRGADCGPYPFLTALPAFWVGLLYDEQSLKQSLDIIRDWTNEDRDMLRVKAPKYGLQVPFKGGLLKDVAEDVVKLAKEGLIRRGRNEEGFLAPIEEIANSGVTLAERMLKLYNEKWGKKIDPIFDELRL